MSEKRARAFGLEFGRYPTGELNKITDVSGVKVGHHTIDSDENKTGVTVILPTKNNIYTHKLVAAGHVINGYGKSIGLMQIEELGVLESPIFLTNTLNVGKVHDAAVGYMIERCAKENLPLTSFNPVVLECNDSYLNHIQNRVVDAYAVKKAIESATDDFEEGAIGAGKGMSCHHLKGGIGSSSRVVELHEKSFTIGVLVLSNHGTLEDFELKGHALGRKIKSKIDLTSMPEKGSIIIVVATDLPVSDRQLKRLIKRVPIGLAKTGSYMGHGSGEVVLGFTTHHEIPTQGLFSIQQIQEEKLDVVFHAVSEAVEEAVINSMFTARETLGYQGRFRLGLAEIFRRGFEEDA